jgi:hypothetical protein
LVTKRNTYTNEGQLNNTKIANMGVLQGRMLAMLPPAPKGPPMGYEFLAISIWYSMCSGFASRAW